MRSNENYKNLNFTYNDLFEFIKDNKSLHAEVAKVDINDEGVQKLITAIRTGTENDSFLHPECEVYLLRLFKENIIKPGEFLTAYSYLMTLMQFSRERELLKEQSGYRDNTKHPGLKINDLRLMKLVENGQLTKEGEEYARAASEKFQTLTGVQVDPEEIKNVILSLDPIEQNVIYIESNFESEGTFKLFSDDIRDNPCCVAKLGPQFIVKIPGNFMEPPSEQIKHEVYPFLPSYTLQNYFLHRLDDSPIEFAPRFGRVNEKTLLRMHQDKKHIIPLYSKYSKTNLLKAHDKFEGPSSNERHDSVHPFLAAMLASPLRTEVLNTLIPSLQGILNKIQELPESKIPDSRPNLLAKELDRVIYDQLNDLSLFPYNDYNKLSQQERYEKFITNKAFRFNYNIFFSRDFNNNSLYNDMLFHILLLHYSGHTELFSLLHKEALKMNPEFMKNENVQVFSLIASRIAHPESTQGFTRPANLGLNNLDVWKKKLEETNDSAVIWAWAKKNDLVQLIQCGLNFFHPYVPLTAETHKKLLEFINRQLKLENSDPMDIEKEHSAKLFTPQQKEPKSPDTDQAIKKKHEM